LRKLIISLAAAAAALALCPGRGSAGTVGNVADVKGTQEQQLFGVGVVVGLRGTGDKGRETAKRTALLLNNGFKFNVQKEDLATKNVALVFVTARIRPFAKQQSKLDVTVSSMSDASSLDGGELLPTPLHAADPEVVYVRAQGKVSVKAADGSVSSPTCGVVSGGGILEREIPGPALEKSYLNDKGKRVDYLELILRRGNFSQASSIADAANAYLRAPQDAPAARAVDAGLVRVEIPEKYRNLTVAFVDELLSLPVVADPPATVTINERTGVVVSTGTVRISRVTISVNGIVLEIKENGTLDAVQGQVRRLQYSSAEIIAIVKELHRAGALQAELITE